MTNEEEKRCPLCAEEMDWTDQQLKPCKCGYEVCVWCWHHIMDMAEKDATEGRCPACRTPYDKDRIVGLESNFQRVTANCCSRKPKQPKLKQKTNEVKKDLSNVRVIQKKMAYIIGLPLSLADEDLLQQKDYFGKYGKVTKVALSRTAGGTIQQFANDTFSVYITYSKEEEAVQCIQAVHGYVLDGRFLRASFGTAKYCHAWIRNMPCNNPSCLYLHSIGAEEDSFGKDETAAVHTRNRVQEIVGATRYLHKRSGSMLPPPVDEHINNHSSYPEESFVSSGLKDVAYATVASGDHLKDKDVIRSSKNMTTFVDIVGGRSSSSGSDKDVNSVSEGNMLNLCSDLSSVCIEDTSNHDKAKISDSKLYSEPFSEVSKADLTLKDTDIREQGWWLNDSDCSGVNNDEDEEAITCINSVLNDGYNEKKFQSLAKSDRIYSGSKSFTNEEIVEHLRRLDGGDDDENSAAVESSIISNILSMDFDDDQNSLWNFQNSDQSRFSFANDSGYANQEMSNIQKPQYQASRARNVTPPGFTKPPPGFPVCMRNEQVLSASSGNYAKNSLSNNHYRAPSIGNLSNSSDDFLDPAIMVAESSKSLPSFDEQTKLWHLMQEQQQPQQHNLHQQSHMPQLPSWTDYYGNLSSRLVDQRLHSYQQPNGYHQQVQVGDSRSEEIQRLGLERLFPMPTSGDVYTRVFGM